ncbi:peptidyl-prolyl cis-trans isomerase B (cyclophilin B) [Paenibacillus amylolyticus]|uniref:Peptidyl-prolyl cis-trans isomerase n=1 Tax=Paenibacillus amylolyticus TaxID=1451 RepID=A0AAP5H929_PAEAM|nr:peptidylprolyl isomerase [Paenibacillus amylolyticus]MDR6727018.1 peptidyl-prolyl cis-trans isomerase B (cyclophilin B) [Paenibacillus amylolyticus]
MINRRKKSIATSLIMALLLIVISGCGRPSNGATPAPVEPEGPNPVATIEMEDGQKIVIELYPDVAPNTVNNFISLANKGFYDGTIFHRVIPGFMIQGGDPDGNGTGGPGYSIKGEFNSNGHKNTLLHTRGVISMARSNALDSAGSQFFIMLADAEHLDNAYASFGKVTEGMEVVDEIAAQERNDQDKPLTNQVMKKVTVDTHGLEYPEPVKMP